MSAQYKVSNILADRHPYTRKLDGPVGPQGVCQGYGVIGMENLIQSISTTLMTPPEVVKALNYLYTLSADDAMKIRMLVLNIVTHITTTLINNSENDAVCLAAVKLLSSLAALPQGSACIVLQGVLSQVIRLLRGSPSTEVCLESCNIIRRICIAWDGREVLLGTEPNLEDEEREHREAVAQDVAAALVDLLSRPSIDQKLQLGVLQSLSQLTNAPRGIEFVLMAGALRALHELLQHYATVHDWVTARGIARDIVHQATLVTWNVAMDSIGKKEAVELDLPALYGKVLRASLGAPMELVTLKSALAGAFAAIFIYEATKSKALDIVDGKDDVLSLLVTLLRQGNALYAPMRDARKHGQPLPEFGCTIEEAGALVTNTVQSIRLVCELPAARERAKELLPLPAEKELRKQLYKATDIEAEMMYGK